MHKADADDRRSGNPYLRLHNLSQEVEVNTIETLIDIRQLKKCPNPLLYDKAADVDWQRDAFESRGIEQFAPQRA